jgi:hypothetical protein
MRSVHILALAVLPSLAACESGGGDDCTPTEVSKRLTIETPTDPALELRINSCRVDIDACPQLCELALERVNIGTFGVTRCTVGFADDAVLMDVDYNVTPSECQFFDDFGPAVGGGL